VLYTCALLLPFSRETADWGGKEGGREGVGKP